MTFYLNKDRFGEKHARPTPIKSDNYLGFEGIMDMSFGIQISQKLRLNSIIYDNFHAHACLSHLKFSSFN